MDTNHPSSDVPSPPQPTPDPTPEFVPSSSEEDPAKPASTDLPKPQEITTPQAPNLIDAPQSILTEKDAQEPARTIDEKDVAQNDRSRGGIGISRPGSVELWLNKNLAAMVVIVIFLSAAIVIRSIAPMIEAPSVTTPLDVAAKPKFDPADLEKLGVGSIGAVMMGLIAIAGAAACGAAFIGWLLVPDARRWLAIIARTKAVRPLPALRGMDLLATAVVYFSVPTILLGLVSFFTGPRSKFPIKDQLLVHSAGMAIGVLVAVQLARHRAGGRHGSNGIWPFWTLPDGIPQRSVWTDIGIGVLAYPLCLWLVALAGLVNRLIHEAFKGSPDTNQIVGELMQQNDMQTMMLIFFSATAGAAFFEEIFFRGMMYNVFYRYVGGLFSAILAALLFAGVHFVYSQILPLMVLAMVLTWLYDFTGRLVSSMTLHAVNNGMALINLMLLREALSAQG